MSIGLTSARMGGQQLSDLGCQLIHTIRLVQERQAVVEYATVGDHIRG